MRLLEEGDTISTNETQNLVDFRSSELISSSCSTNTYPGYVVLAVMGPAAMIGGYLGARYTNRFTDS